VKGLSNLSQIGRGIYAYTHDYDDTLPIGYIVGVNAATDTNWTTLLHGYLTSSTEMTDATLNRAEFLEIFKDPNAQLAGGRVHYSAHPVLMPDQRPGFKWVSTTYKLPKLARRGEVITVMDGTQDPANQNNAHATAWQLDAGAIQSRWLYNAADPDNADPIDPGPNQDTTAAAGQICWRQLGDGANLLYGDGHAETRMPVQVIKANVRVD
jgi:prepilin-type processing-associated H-X9-DG protein